MKKNKLSILILKYLYKNKYTTPININSYLKKKEKNELQIKSALTYLSQENFIKTDGYLKQIGENVAGNMVMNLNDSLLRVWITPEGMNYYKEHLKSSINWNRIMFWCAVILTLIGILSTLFLKSSKQLDLSKLLGL